jgi:C-terminal processing protease CtpA/Prc
MVSAIKKLQKQTVSGQLRGLIFDLRRNSGGLLDQGIKIADMFLRKGRIVSVKERGRTEEVHRAHGPGTFDMPLIVLVDSGSASAAEIVASALQDNARAIVVGDRTFGKASVQRLFQPPWRDDFYIKLTVARYYSPVGRTIQVIGVTPDIEVAPKIDGKMPLGWREENLRNYLDPIQSKYESPNKRLAGIVKKCAAKRGIAEKIHASDPNPQIRYDYQLMKGADYLECLIEHRSGQAVDTMLETEAKRPSDK